MGLVNNRDIKLISRRDTPMKKRKSNQNSLGNPSDQNFQKKVSWVVLCTFILSQFQVGVLPQGGAKEPCLSRFNCLHQKSSNLAPPRNNGDPTINNVIPPIEQILRESDDLSLSYYVDPGTGEQIT